MIITIPPTPARAPTPPTEVVVTSETSEHIEQIDHQIPPFSLSQPQERYPKAPVDESDDHPDKIAILSSSPCSSAYEETPAEITVTSSTMSLRNNNLDSSRRPLHSSKESLKKTYLPSRTSRNGRKGNIFSKILFTLGWVYSICRLLFVILQNLYHIPTYLFFSWILLYPIYFIKPRAFMFLENIMYNMCLYTVASWSWLAGIQVIECGDDIYSLKDKKSSSLSSTSPMSTLPTTSLSHQPNNNGIQSNGSLLGGRVCQPVNNKLNESEQVMNEKNSKTLLDLSPQGLRLSPREKKKGDLVKSGTSSREEIASSSCSPCCDTKEKDKILVLANHQCTTDVPLLFQALVAKTKYVLLWVMDYQFKFTNFGVVSVTHGDYFIEPKTFVKSELTKHCLKNPDKDLIILFPEGGFRYKRVSSSDKYAEKQGWPKLTHLTWPRTGAFLDLMEGKLRFTHIIDLTIFYLDQATCMTILDIVMGRNLQPVYFHYKVFEVSPDEAFDQNWLHDRWLEKEQRMKAFYEDPEDFLRTKAGQLRPVKLSLLRLLFNQVLIFIGCIAMYTIIKYLLSVFIR